MVCPLSPLLSRFGLLPDPHGLTFLGLAGLRYSPDSIPPGRRVPTKNSGQQYEGTAGEWTKRALQS